MTAPARLIRHRGGVPVYQYRTDGDTPSVSVIPVARADAIEQRRHIHDFPALWYAPAAGLVLVAAAGAVIDPTEAGHLDGGVAVLFDPAALGEDGRSPWPAWGAHPLLFPFLHGQWGGLLRLEVRPPPGDRRGTSLSSRSRMSSPGGDRVISRRRWRISRCCEIGMTPGHLTTVVRRRTGRTVQEWIVERRMATARRLLADTDLPVAEVGPPGRPRRRRRRRRAGAAAAGCG